MAISVIMVLWFYSILISAILSEWFFIIDTIFSFQILVRKWELISMDYYLQQEYNDPNESDSDHNHRFYQLLIFTRLARIGETSIHSWLFTQILVIDLDWTSWNERGRLTVCRFGISIHDSIIQYQTRKSYITRIPETSSFRSDGY